MIKKKKRYIWVGNKFYKEGKKRVKDKDILTRSVKQILDEEYYDPKRY